MGRKRIELDYKLFDGLLKCGATRVQCSNILEVSEDTIENRLREDHDTIFTDYRLKKLDHTVIKLTQKAIGLALNGNITMLIFCLKNLCGWADKNDSKEISEKTVINISKLKD